MRFSDLNKAKAEPPKPEPVKKAPPAAAAPRPEPEPRPEVKPVPVVAAEPEKKAPPEPARPAAQAPGSPRNRPLASRQAQRKEAAARPLPPFRDQDAEAREAYARLLGAAEGLLRAADQPYTEKYESVSRACGAAAETLSSNPVLLYYASYSTADDYLKAHSANVALIALAMGLASGLDADELKLLGFCAMAHDIGMTGYSGLYSREARLSEEEFARITLHAVDGAEKLDRIVDLDYKIKDRAKRILLQVHERLDGSGYPDRAAGEELDPLAQLIGIADVYEAMTHPRSWREAMEPPDVLRELIEREGRGFGSAAVKALISALSIYPPGSLVALSSGEIARVRRLNKGSLTRPLVEMLLDSSFEPAQSQFADLMEFPLTSIESSVSREELAERNPSFAGKLELERWWVEW
jgi:HD-GYP domain-containing protein (c-di-GMP phosphodiesterase class II)